MPVIDIGILEFAELLNQGPEDKILDVIHRRDGTYQIGFKTYRVIGLSGIPV